MKHKAEIVLKALLAGHGIVKEETTYMFSYDNRLCMERYKYNNNNEVETVLLPINLGIELSVFITWTDSFTEKEIALISANLALNEINKTKRNIE